MEIDNLLEYTFRGQLRTWLEQNHHSATHCWVAIYRSKIKPAGICLPYLEVVEEALCFGWIDSTLKRLPTVGWRNGSLHDARTATGRN
ncbi:MAG: hypothetical protein IJS73_01985 [Paludibacteraceae bacterium]|nr:hypothetical protein [Paludibacteraceae bacterium]